MKRIVTLVALFSLVVTAMLAAGLEGPAAAVPAVKNIQSWDSYSGYGNARTGCFRPTYQDRSSRIIDRCLSPRSPGIMKGLSWPWNTMVTGRGVEKYSW